MGVLAGGTIRGASPNDAFVEDLSRRSFRYFWEAADPNTGLVFDRFRTNGTPSPPSINVASIAATGFGLSALCIAAHRRWISRAVARARVVATLRSFTDRIPNEHGWFYHFIDATTGERVWRCELSSIDTALLLAGILTCAGYYRADREIPRLASTIFERVDFPWMLNGGTTLSHGWKPESGFLRARWDTFSECLLLYALAIASPSKSIPKSSWAHVTLPTNRYGGYEYVEGGPLFIHQYPQAWLELRRQGWFRNSQFATRANRQFCLDLRSKFPKSYSENVWGITASDSEKEYRAWGIPGHEDQIDGTVVPCAPGGSLMFEPALCLAALETMKTRFGDRIWNRYGFCDAFNPTTGWVDSDALGIDVGITLLSAENMRTGNVWRWFRSTAAGERAHQI